MAGEIKLNNTSFATESSGLITVKNSKLDTDAVFPTFVGMIASFGMSTAPTGWLVCNGAEYAIADYGDLHTAIGTTWGALTNGSGGAGSTHFRVPDLRGAFLRGTDSHGSSTMANSSAFAGPSVGSFENDQIQQFKSQLRSGSQNTVAGGTTASIGYDNPGSGTAITVGTLLADGFGTPRKGDETRPFNAGINYCIKY